MHNKKPGIYGKFGQVHKKELDVSIADDEMLLFTEDKEHRNPVTLKIGGSGEGDFKSFCLLVAAVKGSGKSGWVKTLMDQLYNKGAKFFCIEPKGYDFVTMNIPQDDPKSFDMLRQYGLRPRGYKLSQVIPSFVADEYTRARTWKLDIRDFDTLPKTVQISTWCSFLGIKEMSGPGKALQRILKMGPNGRGPKDIREMVEFVKLDIEQERAKRKAMKAPGIVSTGLLYLLEQKIMTNEIGRREPFDVVKALANNDIVILHTPFDSKNLISMNTYISIAVNNIVRDRDIYIRTNGRKGLLNQPIVVVIEEADALIGKDFRSAGLNLAKHVLYKIPARYRHIGVSLILVTQNPGLIDERFVRQTDYVAGTQVNTEEMRHLLRVRGVPRFIVDNDLNKLEWVITDKIKQWFILQPDMVGEPPKKGWPIYPCTKLLKEGEGLLI